MQGHVYGLTSNEQQQSFVYGQNLPEVVSYYDSNMLNGPDQVMYCTQVHV